MLALQRRQHMPYLQPSSTNNTAPSPSTSQHLTFDQLSQQLAALSASQPNIIDHKLLFDYLQSQPDPQPPFVSPIVGDQLPSTSQGEFMESAYGFAANPAIRIQQSTPTPQLSTAFSQPSMLSATNATASGLNNWGAFANNGQLDSQSLQTPTQNRTARTHQRASSSSSVGSTGSQYQPVGSNAGYSYVAHSENLPSPSSGRLDSSYGADEASSSFSNPHHLPTPSHTPTQDAFSMNSNFNYAPTTTSMDSTMAAHMSMKQALMDQHAPDEEGVPGFGHSARHSVSSYGHDSPATPHTTHGGDEFDDGRFKMPPTDLRHHTIPKFERTYTDAALDELYNPNTYIPHSAPQSNPGANASMLGPYGGSNAPLKNALRAANHARSQSPSSSASRGVSPFRQNSPYVHQAASSFSSSSSRRLVGTAAQVREAQKAEADAHALKNVPLKEEVQPKTISPKDALLDYHEPEEDSKVSLFPEGGASEYEPHYSTGGEQQYRDNAQSHFDTTSQPYHRDSWTTTQFSHFPASSGPSIPQAAFHFAPSSIPGNLHGLPYSSQQYRTGQTNTMASTSDPTPDFPAHLTSMESSASEAAEPSNSQNEQLQKPAASTADTGTYTCTYHGCTLRFETPQKLQKHKREGHRNVNTTGNGLTSAALLERNSQAGPHKCERINPTTGKPCNTIFSRPYDLTRHEDTIHNARKQKVRCALCTEEKTFSRNDALTRHMRVVHPEVDFPGKHRRRGGNHD